MHRNAIRLYVVVNRVTSYRQQTTSMAQRSDAEALREQSPTTTPVPPEGPGSILPRPPVFEANPIRGFRSGSPPRSTGSWAASFCF
jgi:hypothetical protein